MEPVVYDFAVNPHGTVAELLPGDERLMPPGYYALQVPVAAPGSAGRCPPSQRDELDRFGRPCRSDPDHGRHGRSRSSTGCCRGAKAAGEGGRGACDQLLARNGFDREQHERIRADLRRGLIGLAQNRLPASATIEDVRPEDVTDARGGLGHEYSGARPRSTG